MLVKEEPATIEEQLQALRERWLLADAKGRKIIEIRAKLLKMRYSGDRTILDAEEVFLNGLDETSKVGIS